MDLDVVGKGLFGRRVRLRLAIYAFRTPTFFLSEAADSLKEPISAVRDELGRLVDLEMIQRVAFPGDRRVYFARRDSPLWTIIEAAAAVFEDGQVGATPIEGDRAP